MVVILAERLFSNGRPRRFLRILYQQKHSWLFQKGEIRGCNKKKKRLLESKNSASKKQADLSTYCKLVSPVLKHNIDSEGRTENPEGRAKSPEGGDKNHRRFFLDFETKCNFFWLVFKIAWVQCLIFLTSIFFFFCKWQCL